MAGWNHLHCECCEQDVYSLTNCDDAGDILYTDRMDFASLVGYVVQIDGVCYTVGALTSLPGGESVSVLDPFTVFDDCADCAAGGGPEDPNCYCDHNVGGPLGRCAGTPIPCMWWVTFIGLDPCECFVNAPPALPPIYDRWTVSNFSQDGYCLRNFIAGQNPFSQDVEFVCRWTDGVRLNFDIRRYNNDDTTCSDPPYQTDLNTSTDMDIYLIPRHDSDPATAPGLLYVKAGNLFEAVYDFGTCENLGAATHIIPNRLGACAQCMLTGDGWVDEECPPYGADIGHAFGGFLVLTPSHDCT